MTGDELQRHIAEGYARWVDRYPDTSERLKALEVARAQAVVDADARAVYVLSKFRESTIIRFYESVIAEGDGGTETPAQVH